MPRDPLVAIVMATLFEADPLVEMLGLAKVEKRPFPLYQKDNFVLAISGIGKANAAMATALCCSKTTPDWICNIGAAGATASTFPLGAMYNIDRVTEFDRPLLQTSESRVYTPSLLGGFPTASLATQDKPVIEVREREMVSVHADLVDMEAAAVCQAARIFQRPCVVFKFVSDTPNRPGHHDIAENITRYRAPFCEFFVNSVIPALRGE